MATAIWTASGGDTLRILDFDTPRPCLQVEEAGGDWRDVSPKLYPNALFALSVALLRIAAYAPLERADLTDSGIRIEED